MQSSVSDQIDFAMAFLAVDDACQINPGLTYDVPAKLDKELRFFERFIPIFQFLIQLISDLLDIEGLVAEKIGNSETTPHVEFGNGYTRFPGDPVGTVGSTGNASPDGPHLHFAVMLAGPDDSWSGGTAVNPYPMLTASR